MIRFVEFGGRLLFFFPVNIRVASCNAAADLFPAQRTENRPHKTLPYKNWLPDHSEPANF
jgi:hypothetical protein